MKAGHLPKNMKLTEKQFNQIKDKLPAFPHITFKPTGEKRTIEEMDKVLCSFYEMVTGEEIKR